MGFHISTVIELIQLVLTPPKQQLQTGYGEEVCLGALMTEAVHMLVHIIVYVYDTHVYVYHSKTVGH